MRHCAVEMWTLMCCTVAKDPLVKEGLVYLAPLYLNCGGKDISSLQSIFDIKWITSYRRLFNRCLAIQRIAVLSVGSLNYRIQKVIRSTPGHRSWILQAGKPDAQAKNTRRMLENTRQSFSHLRNSSAWKIYMPAEIRPLHVWNLRL